VNFINCMRLCGLEVRVPAPDPEVLSFQLSSVQTPSVSVSPLMSETKFHTHTQKYSFVQFSFYVFKQQKRKEKALD
jgi:hypothetical protein